MKTSSLKKNKKGFTFKPKVSGKVKLTDPRSLQGATLVGVDYAEGESKPVETVRDIQKRERAELSASKRKSTKAAKSDKKTPPTSPPDPEQQLAEALDKLPPPIMAQQTPPGASKPGPYCPVLLPAIVRRSRPSGRKEHREIETDKIDPKTNKPVIRIESREIYETVEKPGHVIGWVRVVQGDERNGKGILYSVPASIAEELYPKGLAFRFAGGTPNVPAKFIEKVEPSTMGLELTR